jgi:hypothetical protein
MYTGPICVKCRRRVTTVTEEVMNYLLFETMTEPEQVSIHGKEKETINPPFKTMVHLKKLTPQDLKRARVSRKILKEKQVCKYCDLEFEYPSFCNAPAH